MFKKELSCVYDIVYNGKTDKCPAKTTATNRDVL
jgi:hypothetical protein